MGEVGKRRREEREGNKEGVEVKRMKKEEILTRRELKERER